MYKMTYPPYGQSDILNTREPIPGVEYAEGAGSAAESAIVKFGDLPHDVMRHMGVVDLSFSKTPVGGDPNLRFTPSPEERQIKHRKPKVITEKKETAALSTSKG